MATEIGIDDEYSRQVSPILHDLQNHYQVKLIVSNADENSHKLEGVTLLTSNLPTNINEAIRNGNTEEPVHHTADRQKTISMLSEYQRDQSDEDGGLLIMSTSNYALQPKESTNIPN